MEVADQPACFYTVTPVNLDFELVGRAILDLDLVNPVFLGLKISILINLPI